MAGLTTTADRYNMINVITGCGLQLPATGAVTVYDVQNAARLVIYDYPAPPEPPVPVFGDLNSQLKYTLKISMVLGL